VFLKPPQRQNQEAETMLLIALLVLALLLVGAGFVVHWLFIAAVIVALIWVISFFAGGIGRRGGAL
jgi:membrane protein implicated in regulation of membrane protease activity